MLLRSTNPIVRVELDSMHTVDTRNVESLFGLWQVFSRCASTMEDGKRLENLSWRIWSRETFCCASEGSCNKSRWKLERKQRTFDEPDSPTTVPDLSSSVESDNSNPQREAATDSASSSSSSSSDLVPARPELRRQDSEESHNKGMERHITPLDLEKIVASVTENKNINTKLPPLPPSLRPQRIVHLTTASTTTSPQQPRREDTTPRPSSPPSSSNMIPESSTSTIGTTLSATSNCSEMSPPADSDASTSTELSSHSIVRGFSLGRISSSIRSSSNLVPTPAPILKNSPYVKGGSIKQRHKKPTFMLGGSSGEGDESSFETRYGKSSNLSDSIRKASTSKTTSFKEEISTRAYESEEVFESDSEEEEESESAIEDDDDVDWEDEDEQSGPSSVNEHDMFQRHDSRPNLTSRRSLLTQAIHEPDRAAALQNLASRSTPAIKRSRTSTPNGPSLAASPREGAEFEMPGNNAMRPKPIIVTTSNTGVPIIPMSPRTTRRNMLSSEMTESLRKHLLWERQQKNSTASAHLKRRHTSQDIKNLKHYPNENIPNFPGRLPPIDDHKASNSYDNNNHFDTGLLEYHTKGW